MKPEGKTLYVGVRKDAAKMWLNYIHILPNDDLRDWPSHVKFENPTTRAIREIAQAVTK